MLEIKFAFSTVEEAQMFLEKLNGKIPVAEVNTFIAQPQHMSRASKKHKKWTQIEMDHVAHLYRTTNYTAQEIAVSIGRSAASVGQVIWKMRQQGLVPERRHRAKNLSTTKIKTNEEDEFDTSVSSDYPKRSYLPDVEV